jgi:hypothetical protein
MRNTLIVVLAGSVLCGCLDSGTSGFHEENEAAAEQPTNVSPIIGGSPPSTILVNEMYEFEPTAADPDGDSLTLSRIGRSSIRRPGGYTGNPPLTTWASMTASSSAFRMAAPAGRFRNSPLRSLKLRSGKSR